MGIDHNKMGDTWYREVPIPEIILSVVKMIMT